MSNIINNNGSGNTNSGTIHLYITNLDRKFGRAMSLRHTIQSYPFRLDAECDRRNGRPAQLAFWLYVLAKEDNRLKDNRFFVLWKFFFEIFLKKVYFR